MSTPEEWAEDQRKQGVPENLIKKEFERQKKADKARQEAEKARQKAEKARQKAEKARQKAEKDLTKPEDVNIEEAPKAMTPEGIEEARVEFEETDKKDKEVAIIKTEEGSIEEVPEEGSIEEVPKKTAVAREKYTGQKITDDLKVKGSKVSKKEHKNIHEEVKEQEEEEISLDYEIEIDTTGPLDEKDLCAYQGSGEKIIIQKKCVPIKAEM